MTPELSAAIARIRADLQASNSKGETLTWAADLRTLLSALEEAQAVRALEWVDYSGDDLRGNVAAQAQTILGLYCAYGDGSWSNGSSFTPVKGGDLALGKSAAQADFNSRIRSLLTPTGAQE